MMCEMCGKEIIGDKTTVMNPDRNGFIDICTDCYHGKYLKRWANEEYGIGLAWLGGDVFSMSNVHVNSLDALKRCGWVELAGKIRNGEHLSLYEVETVLEILQEDDMCSSMEAYYFGKDECSTCRGGGCPHCEPSRYI